MPELLPDSYFFLNCFHFIVVLLSAANSFHALHCQHLQTFRFTRSHTLSWQLAPRSLIRRQGLVIPVHCCPPLLTTLCVQSLGASGKMTFLTSDKHSQVTVRQTGGTTEALGGNRYATSRSIPPTGQKPSCHQAKPSQTKAHVEARSFIPYFLHLLCPDLASQVTCQKNSTC